MSAANVCAQILHDDTTLDQAARQASAQHLHLVITRRGQVVITPQLLPGMVKIGVRDKQFAEVA